MELLDSPPPPTWVEGGASLVRGLDLTGLRLPTQSISNSLLDGITTITPTVRYMSFYCWMLKAYFQAGRKDSWGDFLELAAQVESAIALGNLIVDPSTTGAVGSTRALELLASDKSKLPLEKLVKILAVNAYANPAVQLGLAFDRASGLPGLTEERGLKLAQAFENAVEHTRLGQHFSAGQSASRASRADLEEFGSAALVREPSGLETEVLVNAILPLEPRSSELGRVRTFAVLLALAEVLEETPADGNFFAAATEATSSLPDPLNTCLDGWLRFDTRDMVSASHEAVLKQVHETTMELSEDDMRAVPTRDVLGRLVGREGEHSEAFKALGLASKSETVTKMRFRDIADRVDKATRKKRHAVRGLNRWSGSLIEQEVANVALNSGPGALSILPVAWLLAAKRAEPWSSYSDGPFESRGDVGYSRFGISEVIEPAIGEFIADDSPFSEVMRELALRTVEQHLRMAWARMGVDGQRNVAVLAWDMDHWWPLNEVVPAGQTASRIPQAISWLGQLGLVDDQGLTKDGEKLLTRALSVLEETHSEPA